MSLQILKKHIKDGEFSKIYLFEGNEDYLKSHYYSLLKKKVLGNDADDFSYIEIDGKNLTPGLLSDIVTTYPLTNEKKLVVINDFDFSLLDESTVSDYCMVINNIEDFCVVVIYQLTVKTDKKKKTSKQMVDIISKNGYIVDFSSPSESDLIAWVIRHATHRGKKMDTNTAKYLISLADSSMQNLINEIDKLCAYSTADTIEIRHIDQIVTKSLDTKVFAIADSLLKKDYSSAYIILDELVEMNYAYELIGGLIYSVFSSLAYIKAGSDNMISPATIAKDFSLNEYTVKSRINLAKKVDYAQLCRCVDECMKADIAIKSFSCDNMVIFQKLFANIILIMDNKVK